MSDCYRVEISKDVESLLVLREDWQKMSRDPNGDIDFYLTVNQNQSEVLRPHVVSVKQGDAVKAILVARIDKRPLELALGYKKLSSPPLLFLTVVYGGVLGADSEEVASLLIESVRDALRNGDADLALFHAIDEDSVFHDVLKKTGSVFTRDFYPEHMQRWTARLPGSYDDFLKSRSSNTRHNLKRYAKKFQTALGNGAEVRTFRDPGDVALMLAHTEDVARKTYHRGLGVGFVNNDLTRNVAALTAAKGWLRSYVLYVRGQPCAFWNGWLYHRTFFTWTTGYDPALNDYRPGTFLLQKMFEDLCAERSADGVNFGFGDAQYKRDWSDHNQAQISVLFFAPTAKGISLNLIRTPLVAAAGAARAVLDRTDVLQRVKKAWRARAAKSPQK
jgi:hypothetical protein